jgi:dTDP-4-amino-4,6-dideoxygalactose transaminase
MTTLPAVLGAAPAFPDGLPLVRPWVPAPERLMARLGDVLASGVLTNGPQVRRLEDAVRQRTGVDNVVAVSSCTLGLSLVYQAVGGPGNVVLPSFTFAASAHAVHWAGMTPRWADVDEWSLTLDPLDAAAAVDEATRAVSATHVYGAPCQVDALQRLADDAGLPLVLDAAHGLGSSHDGVPVGRFGTAEVFSLSPTKVLFAGEGGLVATADDDLAARVRLARDYGNPGDYDCRFPGLNSRMSELHATVALHNLDFLDLAVERRNALVRLFAERVAGVPGLRLQHTDARDVSTYKDLTVVVDPEVTGLGVHQLAQALAADGIDTRRYYSPPIHRQQAYASVDARPLPVTDRVAEQVLSLPLWSQMTPEQVLTCADALLAVLAHAREVCASLEDRHGAFAS